MTDSAMALNIALLHVKGSGMMRTIKVKISRDRRAKASWLLGVTRERVERVDKDAKRVNRIS